MDNFNEKNAILQSFLESMAHLPQQGSAAWLDRKHIGGSEIAVLNGTGAFKSMFDWLKERCEIKRSFCPIINSRWGHTFEDIQVTLIEEMWKCKIYETGSVPGNRNIAYSPDGVAVVENKLINMCLNYTFKKNNIEFDSDSDVVETLMTVDDGLDFDFDIPEKLIERDESEKEDHNKEQSCKETCKERYSTILFEFKSPPKNKPKGEIPSYYIAQPLTGLCTLTICDYSVFINSMFRRCSLTDLDWNLTYDRTFHNKDKNGDVEEILALGVFAVYSENSGDDDNDFLFEHGGEGFIDFGSCDEKVLERMFYKESIGTYKKIHSKIMICNNFKNECFNTNINDVNKKINIEKFKTGIMQFINKSRNRKLIGYLPWKLFKIDFLKVTKEPDFVNNLQPIIDKCIDIIRDVRTYPMEERMERLYTYFPEEKQKKIDKAKKEKEDLQLDMDESEVAELAALTLLEANEVPCTFDTAF